MTRSSSPCERHLRVWVVRLCFAVLVLALPGGSLRADDEDEEPDLSNEACLECHGDPEFRTDDGREVYLDPNSYDASVHSDNDCVECHVDIEDDPHGEVEKVEADICADCHKKAVVRYGQGIHGKAAAEGIEEAPTCADCHGDLHTATEVDDEASAVYWKRQAEMCARCHGDEALEEKFHIPVVRPVEAYLESAHARAAAEGEHGATCVDCHGAHTNLPSSDPGSTIWRTRVPVTCGKCHEEIYEQFRASVHGVALEHGNQDVPVCTDCHGEHKILGAKDSSSPVFAGNVAVDTCGHCHADERLVEKYGMAAGKVASFRDSFHGLASRSGRVSVANCASCHGVHDIRPSDDPKSSIHPSNLATTCGECHPGAGETYTLGTVHSGSGSFADWLVGWIRAVYLWLIGLVIGGMVLHNALDWLRKVRYPEPHPTMADKDIPERMPRALRRQHAMMMLSFPVLVYTGFALTYPDAWWAQPLLGWEDEFDVRGIVHRVAATVMVVGFVVHMIYIAVSPQARACMRGLLPKWRDVRNLFGTLAWYVGLRRHRPRSGAFNYAEKAEYWAFMWGTVVMTITGFLLWFENTTLRLLPGWVPAAATALHFYEAILAALAILVWHLYWVIFDPEVYPMDWTWLTGKPPATRVEERREPEEGE